MLALDGKENRKTWYYDFRKKYWMQHDSMDTWERSAMLFILMRTGFNGIWQSCVEANGLFATPAGLLNQTNVKQLFDESMLTGWHDALQHTEIHTGSYTDVNTESMQSGKALIYLDPPYRHSFTTYGTGFNDEDQKALCEWMITMHDAGNIIMMSIGRRMMIHFSKICFQWLHSMISISLTLLDAGRNMMMGHSLRNPRMNSYMSWTDSMIINF